MDHNFSLENQITNGIAQYIEEIKTDLNTINIVFTDIKATNKIHLEVIGFNNFTIKLDSPEDITRNRHDFVLHTLIGFSYDKIESGFLYCMKTDGYEIMFESTNFPSIRKE